MTEGIEESSIGLVVPPGSASPADNGDTGQAPEEKREETVAGGEGGEEEAEGDADGGDGGDGEQQSGALGILGCCVCIEVEKINRCLRSEKICILPILACLLSLALCTAGLKWVFVDKIFEYDPPTHLDPKRIGQGPIIISADPTLRFPAASLTSTIATSTARPEVLVEGKSTAGPYVPQSPRATPFTPSVVLAYHADQPTRSGIPTVPKHTTTNPQTTVEFNDIIIPTISPTSTTTAAKTSSHVTHCSNSQKNYCVNGGECFTLEVMPGSTKFLCRCLVGYTGNRCQETVPKRVMNPKQHLGIEFMEAEELYQKRVLTITGICIALLVVGIMCVVAYCKTKKQRKRLHDRLRQSLRKERNNMASLVNRPQTLNCSRENLQLVNQCVSKNATPTQHVTEKETETSFSTSQYASSAHQTTVTHVSSHSWRNGWSSSVLSDSQSALVMSLAENSQHATPSHRGRLNATSGARDSSAYLKDCGDTANSFSDSPYSERYASSVTTLTQLSSMPLASPATPESPPSEMLPPLSGLATSVPSVAISPSAEDERPLLSAATLQTPSRRDRNQYERNSAHYNHGQDAYSSPIIDDDDYQITCDRDVTLAPTVDPTSPQNFPVTLANTNNNNNGYSAKRPKANGHGDNMLESDAEEEAVGEDTPFLTLETATDCQAVRSVDSSRTNSGTKR